MLSFAQFEREIIGERIRDKKLLTARQGKYIGGQPKLGLDIVDRRYVINSDEAKLVKRIFKLSLQLQSCQKVADCLNGEGLRTKVYRTKTGKQFGGEMWSARRVYDTLVDEKYIGRIVHKEVYTQKRQTKRFALLRRLVYCGECGSLIMPAWTNNHGREYRYPAERRRVLELLVKSVTVTKQSVEVRFLPNGIEQIVDELAPLSERTNG